MVAPRTDTHRAETHQMRPVHGRETSGNAAMARPEGHKPTRAAVSEGTRGGTPTRIAQTPECDGAREQNGPTGRLPAPRSQKRPDDQTGEVKPGRGSHDQPLVRTPRERQGRSQSELKPWRELEDPTLMGTSKVSSRDGATGSDSNPTDPEE